MADGIVYNGITINQTPTITLITGEKIEGARGIAIKVDGGVVKKAASGDNAIGITLLSEEEMVAQGEDLTVQIKDIGLWKTSEVVEIGDELTSDANGLAKKAASGDFITGIAVRAAEAVGEYVSVQITKSGYKA